MSGIRPALLLLAATTALAVYLDVPSARGQDTQTPGNEFQDCPDCPVMVILPPGRYGMLMPPIDQGRPFAEGENRLVIITEPFAVGKFEVTFDEWNACVSDGKCDAPEDEGWGQGRLFYSGCAPGLRRAVSSSSVRASCGASSLSGLSVAVRAASSSSPRISA